MRVVNINTGERIDSDYGLTQREAKKRLEKHGYNELIRREKMSPFKIFLSQFGDFMTWVLMAATAISGFMGEKADAVTILIIIVLNAVLGFIQEYKTERSLEALKELAAPTAKVIRDGKLITIKARELVIGDIIELEAGDRIPADCVLIKGDDVNADESILTGESIPVEKKIFKGIEFPSGENMLYMGCSIVRGRGRARVIAVGMNTEMGKIAGMLQNIETGRTPLQNKLDKLGEILVYGCIIICGIVTVTGIIRGEDAYKMFLIGVSLAVAAIPEGLPAIVTVSLALGVQRMMKRNALVRKLPAVETLGCTNVICSDKTGTLTQNKMTVKKIYIVDRNCDVTGDGYSTKGDIICNGSRVNVRNIKELRMLIEASVICNNSSIPEEDRKVVFIGNSNSQYSGDPTEISLLIMGAKSGIYRGELLRKYRVIKENPFDSERKMMSVLCGYDRRRYLFVKGAPERVLNKCKSYLENGEETSLSSSIRQKITYANNRMAESALRVLAVAYKEMDSSNVNTGEDDLVFLGLVGMIDPPREEVRDSVIECRLAGIIPVMITGDHKLTARAIASELKILDKDGMVITGEELDRMNDSMLEKIIDRARVFARVNPSHKYRIVRALKKNGMVVAMTGDGVNDAPAIKEADIGIAMGISGTDVTKEVSSMILLDDNFATIVSAVREGRVIYDNIRKFLRYLLSCNIGEVLTMFISSFLSLPIPLLPIQILLVNLATDGLPAMALSLEPGEKDVMSRRPRRKDESIFSDGLRAKIILRGSLIGLCTIAAFSMTLVYFEGNLRLSRTVALATLVMSQLFHVFECRSERHSVFKIGFFTNIYLVAAVLSSMILLITIIYIPWLQSIFYTQGLNLLQWGIVLAFSGTISLISSLIWYSK
ncbi:calcium-translocating P-type ATPase, SERCA-type [Fonticella tunisiensis]|uniref:P-type Ca(2+) transporter n=1 Tax=Fonticella tunisiensis TaxID=1096341 RepID=A0A4R7KU96_9CLOT|nr:calcium-translocating P-type ATPase, SERCA-type [Fonticella tunisiensis]TDT61874.1 Ca2+-transporting ATPase [Fonticella tunisiensis]